MKCPTCGHSLDAMLAPVLEAASRDVERRRKIAAYKYERYHNDPAYRARHLARAARSTTSRAVDRPVTVRTFRLGE
jgi:hypothetical protein